MHWIAPSKKDLPNGTLEKRLWGAADQFWANSGLTPQQYLRPIPDLIFLRFAEIRFAKQRAQLKSPSPLGGERVGVRGGGHPRPSGGRGAGGEDNRFDFVLANPPFNVNAVDTAMRASARRNPESAPQDLPGRQDHERLKDSVGYGPHGNARRFPFGLPRTDNVNYLCIQLFYSALKSGEAGTSGGRAGFVMAHSASDARASDSSDENGGEVVLFA